MIAVIVAYMIFLGLPPFSAEDAAEVAGASCRHGCIVGDDGWVYELQRRDLEWLGRAVECEAGVYGEGEQSAVAWALSQQLYQWHKRGLRPTLSAVVQSYSSCCSARWSSEGPWHHDRITARADYYRALDWGDIPARTRTFVLDWVAGFHPNATPGIVWWFAHGFEKHAPREAIGPFYSNGPIERGNVYYKLQQTVFWKPWTVRLVPATQEVNL